MQPVIEQLRQPVGVLEGLSGDREREAVVIEQLSFGGDGPAAGEVVPEVGLVIALATGDDKDQGRAEEELGPGESRQRQTTSPRHEASPRLGCGSPCCNYRLKKGLSEPEAQSPVRLLLTRSVSEDEPRSRFGLVVGGH